MEYSNLDVDECEIVIGENNDNCNLEGVEQEVDSDYMTEDGDDDNDDCILIQNVEETAETIHCPECGKSYTCLVEMECTMKHVLCYSCVKFFSDNFEKCVACDERITREVLDNPKFISVSSPKSVYQWILGDGNDWHLCDLKTNRIVERAYRNKKPQCNILLDEQTYVVHFGRNIVYRPGKHFTQRGVIKRGTVRQMYTFD